MGRHRRKKIKQEISKRRGRLFWCVDVLLIRKMKTGEHMMLILM